jgi:hypothetical protein
MKNNKYGSRKISIRSLLYQETTIEQPDAERESKTLPTLGALFNRNQVRLFSLYFKLSKVED